MSYDLMVFRPDVAPKTRPEFMNWFHEQTKWSENHSYFDPIVTSEELRNWFLEMIKTFPALNGPFAKEEDEDSEYVTDYSIGRDVIYAAFSWSLAEQAYPTIKALAEKYKVGFFDVSADDGDILFPDDYGNNKPIDNPSNLSSIQKIKNSAAPGQEGKSVKEILYSKINFQDMIDQSTSENLKTTKNKRKWWQKLFGLK